jgi:hypothetical protein
MASFLVEWLKSTFATLVRRITPKDGRPEASTSVEESRLGLRVRIVITQYYLLAARFDRFDGTSRGWRQRLTPWFFSDNSLDRTLRMNARQRINGMIADRAAFPHGIKDGCVTIRGNHQNLLVSPVRASVSYPWRFYVLTGLGSRHRTQRASMASLPTGQPVRWALPDFHDMVGHSAIWTTLTQRLPGESKKGLPSHGISCFKINDLG